jgi:putative phosphoesterase
VRHSSRGIRRIGIIADSHGDIEATRLAIKTLEQKGADRIVHLGDICDSLDADTLDEAVRLLSEKKLCAVKGNNDYLIETTLLDKDPGRFLPATRSFIKELPIKIEWDGMCFAHSLPFDFLRSFYEPIDTGGTERARDLFALTTYRILFAGHSHTPALFRWRNGHTSRRPMEKGPSAIALDPKDRYIIIVGAVARGECGLFDKEGSMYERIRILGEMTRPGP